MNELKPKIYDETSGLEYVLAGDTFQPLNCRRTMTVLSESGGGCTERIWKKRIHFCSIT